MSKENTENKKAAKKQKKQNKVVKYFRDLRAEVKKVVWPSKAQVLNNTGIVLAVVVICGLFLAGVDSLLLLAVKALLGA